MSDASLQVVHVYDRDARQFESDVNEALKRLLSEGAVIGDIKYVSDAPTPENRTGGFGALIIFERGEPKG